MKEFKGSNIIFPVEYAGLIEMQEKPVYGDSNVLDFECVGEETAKANAHLFATSPELLEAAQKVCDSFEAYYSIMSPVQRDSMKSLYTAIDKALNY